MAEPDRLRSLVGVSRMAAAAAAEGVQGESMALAITEPMRRQILLTQVSEGPQMLATPPGARSVLTVAMEHNSTRLMDQVAEQVVEMAQVVGSKPEGQGVNMAAAVAAVAAEAPILAILPEPTADLGLGACLPSGTPRQAAGP